MKYPVFIQALALTIVVLIIGLYIGVTVEQGKLQDMDKYYSESEITLMDILAFNNLLTTGDADCETLGKVNLDFMNRAYDEAVILEDFESAGKLTDNLKDYHKKYDVIRTFLWINVLKTKELCDDSEIHTIVYLYNYKEEDLSKQATQNVWSKVLNDVKEELGDSIFLIPIARDTNLGSLEALISEYDIGGFPAIIVDEKHVLTEDVTKERLLSLLE